MTSTMRPLTEVSGPVLNIPSARGNIINIPRSRQKQAKLSIILVTNEENSQVVDETTVFHGHPTIFSDPHEHKPLEEQTLVKEPEHTHNVFDIPNTFTRLDIDWDFNDTWFPGIENPRVPEEVKPYNAGEEEDEYVLNPFDDFFGQNLGIDDVISRDIIRTFSDEWSTYLNLSDDPADNIEEVEDDDKENCPITVYDKPDQANPSFVKLTIYNDDGAYENPNQYMIHNNNLDPRFRPGMEYKIEKEEDSKSCKRYHHRCPTLSAWAIGSYMYDLIRDASPSHIRLMDLNPNIHRLLYYGIVPTGSVALLVVEDAHFILRAEGMGWVVVRQDITAYCCLTEKYGAGTALALEQIAEGCFDMKDLEWRRIVDVGIEEGHTFCDITLCEKMV